MQIARVFPRRTKATPDDALVFTGPPPKDGLPDVDEVHVSVAFTYDLPKAYDLAERWAKTGINVRIGGPAFDSTLSHLVVAQTDVLIVLCPNEKDTRCGNYQSQKGGMCWTTIC